MIARLILLLCASLTATPAGSFTVASYNVENYLDQTVGTRPAKSDTAKAKIREVIRTLNADVLALQEMGSSNALLELRASLKTAGLDYPFWAHIPGFDTNIHVAVLSRLPIIADRSHSREGFLLNGRRFRVSRGIAELDFQVNPTYQFTLFVAHLKSRRAIAEADQEEMREQEAMIVREKIEARLKANPKANILLAGDLNDVKNSRSTRHLLGRRNSPVGLIDTRPAERNGDDTPPSPARFSARTIAWTHFFSTEDSYSRIDYILLSQGMAREWDPAGTFIPSIPNWGIASDHRPIIAAFFDQDR